MDDESPGLGLDLPEAPQKPGEESHYRVLARKYRPQTFAELIGQDAMVKTLGNAIERGRIAHAFLLTGVRWVGKTSTARLVAKALNCIGPDGQGGPRAAQAEAEDGLNPFPQLLFGHSATHGASRRSMRRGSRATRRR